MFSLAITRGLKLWKRLSSYGIVVYIYVSRVKRDLQYALHKLMWFTDCPFVFMHAERKMLKSSQCIIEQY